MARPRHRLPVLLATLSLAAVSLLVTAPAGSAAAAWTLTANQQLPGTPPTALLATSCATADFCMAVSGQVFDEWNGTGWTSTPTPDTEGQLSLTGVSCPSTTFCLAVGNDGGRSAVGEAWNGTAWSAMSIGLPTPPPDNVVQLGAVSCLSETFCAVVGDGFHSNPTIAESFLDTWNGTTWATTMVPPDPDGLQPFTGVSCTSPTFCMAVGTSGNPSGTLSYRWNGIGWTPEAMPSNVPGIAVNAVSCASSTFCEAVGSRGTGLLAEKWNGSEWAIQSASSPVSRSALYAVDCLSASLCQAVGEKGYNGPSLIDVFNGTTWALATAPAPTVAGLLDGISCVSAAECEAVGGSIPVDYRSYGLIVSTYQPPALGDPTVTVAASTTASLDGTPLTLTATVSPTDGAGTVTIYDGYTATPQAGCAELPLALVNGKYQASCTTTFTPNQDAEDPDSPQAFFAEYTGGGSYLPSVGSVTVVAYPSNDASQDFVPAAPAFQPLTVKLPPTPLTGTLVWKVIQGVLPAGLKLNGTSKDVTGTPTVPGVSDVYLGVSETSGKKQTYVEHLYFTISPLTAPPVSAVFSVARSFSIALKATGGKGTSTWSAAAGALPAGVVLSSTGTLSGAISTPGSYTFTVDVRDHDTPAAQVASDQITLSVQPIVIMPYSAPNGVVGGQYSSTEFQAVGGKTPVTWSLTGGALPPGLHLSVGPFGDTLGGTPTVAGVYTFALQVADSSHPANVASQQYTITITG